jgi:hypothetical protein
MRIEKTCIGWADLDHVLSVGEVKNWDEEESPCVESYFEIYFMFTDKPRVFSLGWGEHCKEVEAAQAEFIAQWKGRE